MKLIAFQLLKQALFGFTGLPRLEWLQTSLVTSNDLVPVLSLDGPKHPDKQIKALDGLIPLQWQRKYNPALPNPVGFCYYLGLGS